jgi:hypothetical protein
MNVDTDRTDQGGGTGREKREEGRGKNEVSRDLSYPFIPGGKEPILI